MIDVHETYVPTTAEIAEAKELLLGYMFPVTPKTDSETEVLNNAALLQAVHEHTIADSVGNTAIPNGTKSFSIGTFSMSFGDGNKKNGLYDASNICPKAYAILLRNGLLYRGVRCNCDGDY